MRGRKSYWINWLGYIFWALFVNAVNVWLITPLVEDYALFGVIALFVLILLWITSIPKSSRNRWIGFTTFSLLLGNGISSVATYPWAAKIGLSLVMAAGLAVLAWIFARVRVLPMVLSAVCIFVANLLLPMAEWPFLTHFSVAYYGRLRLNPQDMSAPPLVAVRTPSGHALVALTNVVEKRDELLAAAKEAVHNPHALNDLLVNYGHRYQFVEVREDGGRFVQTQPTPQELAALDPNALVRSFFPFTRASWTIENGQPIQFMDPSLDPRTAMRLTLESANLPVNVLNLAIATRQQEMTDWRKMLKQLGVQQVPPALDIRNGRLTGTYAGHAIDVPVRATAVIGYGSFTGAGLHQALVEGANVLQVVSLDTAPGRVVATYQADARLPLPNDIVIGPVDNSGRDAIFVNTSPAFILQAEAGRPWKTLYTATSPTLRFEAALRLDGDRYPEIITDDPSLIRDNPIRYFSSYTLRDGQLYRNWRVYHTNVVNVIPVQFEDGGPTYIVAGVYSSGKFVVLRRHDVPVVPIAAILLGLIICTGWVLRWRERGASRNDQA